MFFNVAKKEKGFMIVLTVMLLSFLGGGSYLDSFGKFVPSQDVAKAFQTCHVMEGYDYYCVGPEHKPDAVIGIKQGYTLKSKIWKHITMTPEILKTWMNMIHSKSWPLASFGSYLQDSKGNQVGLWYSEWDTTSVRVSDDKKIVVSLPRPTPAEDMVFHRDRSKF